MLHRQDKEGLILISQPAHAWVSGQLARNWGNETFGHFAPAEEVCFAAEQHDIGFLEWEQAPTLDHESGLPHTFMNLPTEIHLGIWSKGIRELIRFGRYPALLVSLHFTGLCRRHCGGKNPQEMQMAQNFLDDQEALQSAVRTSLLNDVHYAPFSSDETIERNQKLLSLWDLLSLVLCAGVGAEQSACSVPAANSQTCTIVLRPIKTDPPRVQIEPWPFRSAKLQVVCEGRRLLKTYKRADELHNAVRAASPVPIVMELTAG